MEIPLNFLLFLVIARLYQGILIAFNLLFESFVPNSCHKTAIFHITFYKE
jgi:hypothetical protein